MIEEILGIEDGNDVKLDDLGQGTQRLIIASILKAYLDILIEKNIQVEDPVLILFEEPEIYLHPKLKRALNSTLESIAKLDGHQIIITTHDPYFAFMNFQDIDGTGKKIYSFAKENGETKAEPNIIDGIEDELLFTFLYSLCKKEGKDLALVNLGMSRDYFRNGTVDQNKPDDLTYIRHQIHHLGDNNSTKGMILQVDATCSGRNYYTQQELNSAIKAMTSLLQ